MGGDRGVTSGALIVCCYTFEIRGTAVGGGGVQVLLLLRGSLRRYVILLCVCFLFLLLLTRLQIILS